MSRMISVLPDLRKGQGQGHRYTFVSCSVASGVVAAPAAVAFHTVGTAADGSYTVASFEIAVETVAVA